MTFQERIDKLKGINDDIIHKKDKGKENKEHSKEKGINGKRK
jgi:hypothetical protein